VARGFLEVDGVVVRFGGVRALDGPSFDVAEGEICGLIGPNGAGKTTLFNCVTRIYQPESGSIRYEGVELLRVRRSRIAEMGIARTFQNLGLIPTLSVRENVAVGAHTRLRAGFASSSLWLPRVIREERGLRSGVSELLERLDLMSVADESPESLPFGTRKRVELARALVMRPRLLLLDEPACGLTHGEVSELGALIVQLRRDYDLTVLLVEHHMAMVMAVSDRVVVLDVGRKIAEGSTEQVRKDEKVIAAYLGTAA
jgi:branched-chain amino acid transport system ATP-binding protein